MNECMNLMVESTEGEKSREARGKEEGMLCRAFTSRLANPQLKRTPYVVNNST